jgi:hypothetical protein
LGGKSVFQPSLAIQLFSLTERVNFRAAIEIL